MVIDIEEIIAIATEHGQELGLEVEIGDLEQILRVAWNALKIQVDVKDHPSLESIFESADSEVVDGSVVNAQTIIQAAEIHGQYDDPDHQAGDLQDALRVVWSLLDEDGRNAVISDAIVNTTLNAAEAQIPGHAAGS